MLNRAVFLGLDGSASSKACEVPDLFRVPTQCAMVSTQMVSMVFLGLPEVMCCSLGHISWPPRVGYAPHPSPTTHLTSLALLPWDLFSRTLTLHIPDSLHSWPRSFQLSRACSSFSRPLVGFWGVGFPGSLMVLLRLQGWFCFWIRSLYGSSIWVAENPVLLTNKTKALGMSHSEVVNLGERPD